jgi:hypothetical protein
MKACVSGWILAMTIVTAASAQSFPDQLTGTWTGVMRMYKDGKVRDSVNIRFTVKPGASPNTWSWKTDYLSEKMPMTKDYTLRLLHEASQTYELDEGGGVVLNDYLVGNKLYCVFETHDVMLTSTYELRDGALIFEVTSGKKLGERTEVVNYSVQHVQRAILRRSP